MGGWEEEGWEGNDVLVMGIWCGNGVVNGE